MSEGPARYRVVYSEQMRSALRVLVARARLLGMSREVLSAAREIDRRLSVYPQFGEPMFDLVHEAAQVWVAAISPLVVRYAIYEEQRLVVVAAPFRPLRGSGL